MRIFLYEFFTGGGLLGQRGGAGLESLAKEGGAMVRALAADFARAPGVEVFCLRDGRFDAWDLPGVSVRSVSTEAEEAAEFDRLAATCDWTVVIAPEMCHHLLRRSRRVVSVGGRLLGPGPTLVELASDKHATAEFLARAGVLVPSGRALDPGDRLPGDFPCPAVLKPRLGAGSQGVQLILGVGSDGASIEIAEPSRVEKFCPGLAASVSLLCGPAGQVTLPPCQQRLSQDGRFSYHGGALPLPQPLATRAAALARKAVAALPDTAGYLGVDLVLGDDPTGRDDVVIEINPRLTTSYIGLRAVAETNLAAAMLAVCQGRHPELCFRPIAVEFESDGTVDAG